jgi:menaquinone-dependent protoporphyrinogen oxidase
VVIVTEILIAYGTTEGQTAKIAAFLVDVFRDQGHEARAVDIKGSGAALLENCAAVIVGASIHMGKHEEYVRDFVRKNRSTLVRLPSAFFSVSLAASGDPANAEAYVENFVEQTGWRPDQVGLFGGALLYTQYGFIKRQMMKKIVRGKPGNLSTDTSRDHVYTEWDDVTRFAEAFLERLRSLDAGETNAGAAADSVTG